MHVELTENRGEKGQPFQVLAALMDTQKNVSEQNRKLRWIIQIKDLFDCNADAQWIDWTLNENFFFLISTNDNWCQQQLLASTRTHCTQHMLNNKRQNCNLTSYK